MRPITSRFSLLSLPLMAALSMPSLALDLRVTTFADDDDGLCNRSHCSLREAVAAANDAPEAVRIILSAGEYRLERNNLYDGEGEILDEDDNQLGDLDVTGSLTLVGAGASQTILHGGRLDRLIEVLPQGRLVLSNLTLTGGRTPHRGAGLENHGSTELFQVRVVNNAASSAYLDGEGGGLSNTGELRINRSTIWDNSASGSEASFGSGGGIYNTGTLWVRDSRIGGNHCSDDNDVGPGCGVYNAGVADIARSLLDANLIRLGGSGSAILNLGQLQLSNSTLSGNSSGEVGAALENGAPFEGDNRLVTARLVHVTIAGNRGYGLINRGELILRNSIIAGNTHFDDPDVPANCQNVGPFARYSARGLLRGIDGGNCNGGATIVDATTFTRHLFPLADNNQTQVFALRRTSAAIDAGEGSCASHDQRGLNRPRDGNGDGVANCDLGSFERAYP